MTSGLQGHQTTALGAMIGARALAWLGIGISERTTSTTYDRAIVSDRTSAGPTSQIAIFPTAESQTAASAVLEIRRLSGFTWEELADVFDVSRRSVHHWAGGKTITASHDQRIRRVLAVLRRLDQGSAAQTRNLLLSSDTQGVSILDMLKAGAFDRAMERAASIPRFARPHLTPLSAEAQQRRKPLSPVELVGALQDTPEVHIKALPTRFARPPKAKS